MDALVNVFWGQKRLPESVPILEMSTELFKPELVPSGVTLDDACESPTKVEIGNPVSSDAPKPCEVVLNRRSRRPPPL